jgi:hypothetical protein
MQKVSEAASMWEKIVGKKRRTNAATPVPKPVRHFLILNSIV